MKLVDRFALLELERDDGIRTFLAREIATGRGVQVHLLPHTDARNAALLGRLARSPDFVQRQILDRGYHEGIPYVVTVPLAHRMTFREWMTAMDRISASSASLEKQFAGLFERRAEEPLPGRRGQWKVPVPRTINQTATAGTMTSVSLPARSATAEAPEVSSTPGSSRARVPVLEYPRLPLRKRDLEDAQPDAGIAGPMAFDPVVSRSLAALSSATSSGSAAVQLQPLHPVEPVESERPVSRLRSGTKSALALALGVAAALAFLALVAAVWAFRPR